MATDLQFNVTALDRATATFLKLAEQVDRLAAKLDKLDGKKAKVTVEVDTDKADREVGAFATNMQKRIAAAVKSLPDIKLNADSSDADKRIVELRKELSTLSGKRIGIDISAEDARAAVDRIRAELAKVNGSSASVQVKADTAAAIASLDAVEGKVKGLDGKTAKVKVDVDKSLSDSLIQVTRLGSALRALALPAAGIAAAPQIAALGSAAVSASGAVALLPAAVGAAGLAAATASISFGTLTKYFTADSDKKKKEAFDSLSASGKNLATTIDGLKPRFEALRHAVQDAAFKDLAAQVKPLADAYLPSLQRAMVGIAGGFNTAAKGVAQFLTAPSVVKDLGGAFDNMQVGVNNATKAVEPLVRAFVDLVSVGSQRLPMLGQGVANLAEKFAHFIDGARESGKLGEWIDVGIAKVEQLGRIAANTGGILLSIFKAADSSGADFLGTVERITGGVNAFLKSAEGQGALVGLFREIRATVDALAPGFQALGSAAAYVIAQLSQAGVLHEAGAAISALVISVAPLAKDLGDLAANVLPPVLRMISALAPVLGPVAAAFLTWKLGMAGLAAVQGPLAAMTSKLADAALNAGVLTEKFTGSAAAGEKVASAGAKVGEKMNQLAGALPLIGAGVVLISAAYDTWGGKADEAAQKVINGSLSMRQAIAAEAEQIHSNQIEWLGGMNAQESYAAAARNVKTELDKQMATLSPMQRLQADVAIAQANLNDAVAQFGPKSQQAVAAAGELNSARDREKLATDGAKQAEQSLGDAITETSNKASAAANADIAYQQGLLSLADASKSAAAAARDHAAGSDEVTRANLAVQQASLSAADAARRKAEADGASQGASVAAALGAQAFKDELQRQADTLTGPAHQAALDNIALLGGQKGAADTARTAANLYKTELQTLADKENGPLRDAILSTITNFDNLGGAHATAEQKAGAQRAALQRLADQTTGPTHDAIMGMIHDLDAVPKNTNVTVTGTGVVNGIRSAVGSTAPGAGHARGGVLPGYTPGRDVHTYRSATGGTLHLSGGEAVMRPEWTRAVGVNYVHSANAAARAGGVGGVRRHMSAGRFADGGIVGAPHQRLATGGFVMSGTPWPAIPDKLFQGVQAELVKQLVARIVPMVKAAEAAAAAAAAAARSVASGVGAALGGGGGRGFIIAHESGGNPRAQNPTSTASGLYQMINGTWKAYGGSTPTAKQASVAEQNAVADRYVAARYGSWDNAARFWASHHWYDRGGYLMPGSTMAMNSTGRPERVLDPVQTRVWDQVSAATAGGGGRAMGGDGALLTEVRALRGEVHALRGDVDHHDVQGALVSRADVTNQLLARLGAGSAAGSAQAGRVAAELGAF